jgi:hypothetical protein
MHPRTWWILELLEPPCPGTPDHSSSAVASLCEWRSYLEYLVGNPEAFYAIESERRWSVKVVAQEI